MRNFLLTLIVLASLGSWAKAQNTMGVITHVDSLTDPGFNLYYPFGQSSVFLLDNCGRVVNEWTDDPNFAPSASVYLMPNGNLVKTKYDVSIAGDPIFAGGGGEFIEIRDWDNNLLWEYELEDSFYRLHHDIAPMANGNVLAIAWEKFTAAEAIAAGRDTSLLDEGEVWSEMVLELKPVGTDSFDIVWEWHAWDHLIQDYDSTKANYGVIADNPNLINLNYGSFGGDPDWLHFNGIDFNSSLDQIVLSCPTFNEIWIIDHSTSTASAAGHAGGLGGKGGDLIFRWGNPEAYGRGDTNDVQLGFQHDPHWVDLTLSAGSDPDYGKIMIFNNRGGGNYSTVDIITPVFDTYDWEYQYTGNVFAPAAPGWSYSAPNPTDFFSPIISGAQRLSNGNTLICSGRPGHIFEITPSNDIVWEYISPMVSGLPGTNGDTIALASNMVFRMYRYPTDYGAFTGRTLISGDYIELNADTTLCNLPSVGIEDPALAPNVSLYPNPATDRLTVDVQHDQPVEVEIFDLVGNRRWKGTIGREKALVDLNGWAQGLYFVRVNGNSIHRFVIQR